MSEYSKFRNLDSFQCNVCHHFDRFNCTCSEEPYCVIEIERAYQQGRADLLKNIRESAKHLGYDDIEDLLSYVEEKEQTE